MQVGFYKDVYEKYHIKVPVTICLERQTSNLLLAGKSGSGKSLTAILYIWNMLHTRESLCYIADYKGGFEYETFEGTSSYASGESAIDMILQFYDFFTEVRRNRIRLKQHITLVIEEWFGLLVFAEAKDKKLKAELMSKVAEMLSVARGLNLGIMLCIQRADSTNFASGSREQFQMVLSLGRCSSEQFRMLGFSGELEENPSTNYKAGQGLLLVDGQDGVQEIIVPYITNPDVLTKNIRYFLERQSDISSQIRAIVEDKSVGLRM